MDENSSRHKCGKQDQNQKKQADPSVFGHFFKTRITLYSIWLHINLRNFAFIKVNLIAILKIQDNPIAGQANKSPLKNRGTSPLAALQILYLTCRITDVISIL
ncbi:hypothetical protein [Paraburkholderia aspalathi]|uniref:hypothetical protein n=1 Tax=Paraburkholderia aspalathi TaxID=1324617 RepID=UPI00190E53A3|nr:hypothetical protein [Paraburkholderia aspalathi]MBK3844662.1 hypothetical protein [Paraburkholderia aspalathi]